MCQPAAAKNLTSTSAEFELPQVCYRLSLPFNRPQPVRCVYIPKADGKQRPLGIPTIEDKIAQNAVTLLLTAIYEQAFLPISYGFRPNRNAHQAIEEVKATIAQKKVSWVLDADIHSFFDEMDHQWLIKFLEHRIADKTIITFIRQYHGKLVT